MGRQTLSQTPFLDQVEQEAILVESFADSADSLLDSSGDGEHALRLDCMTPGGASPGQVETSVNVLKL